MSMLLFAQSENPSYTEKETLGQVTYNDSNNIERDMPSNLNEISIQKANEDAEKENPEKKYIY